MVQDLKEEVPRIAKLVFVSQANENPVKEAVLHHITTHGQNNTYTANSAQQGT